METPPATAQPPTYSRAELYNHLKWENCRAQEQALKASEQALRALEAQDEIFRDFEAMRSHEKNKRGKKLRIMSSIHDLLRAVNEVEHTLKGLAHAYEE